jgi:hypothetical protein
MTANGSKFFTLEQSLIGHIVNGGKLVRRWRFHAPTEAAFKMSRLSPSRMPTHASLFFSRHQADQSPPNANPKNLIIQTATQGWGTVR